MTIRRTILLFCLLLLPLAAVAEEGAQTYVIKKGDTLWGISNRFIKDPYYWPNLWSNNPEIGNPHFIYPGQTVAIYDGRLQIVPVTPAPPVEEVETTPTAEPAVPEEPAAEPEEVTLIASGGVKGFIDQSKTVGVGTLVDTVDNRLLMAKGDRVFVTLRAPETTSPGDKFSLFELGKEVQHPVTGETVGYQATALGALQIIEQGPDVATAIIVDSSREIQRGALLQPYRAPLAEVALKKAEKPLAGYIVSANEGKIALSQQDIIYVDLGTEDGLEVGNLLYVSRQRKATEYALGAKELQLPDILLGSAVVVETHPHTAAALILKSAQSMFRGDRVTAATE